MKSRAHHFFVGFFVWEALVAISIACLLLLAKQRISSDDISIFMAPLLYGIVIVAICFGIASKFFGLVAVLLGTIAGVICMMGGGVILAVCLGGFETPGAVFIGSLALSVPSGIGGGIVSWLNRRRV